MMKNFEELKDQASIEGFWIGAHTAAALPNEVEAAFPVELMRTAQAEIATWPGYQPTKLQKMDSVARAAGVGEVLYKDESTRFGLGSFKALGGAYAVVNYLANKLSADLGRPISMNDVRSGKHADEVSALTVATATDGNHGRSVAWGAKMAGCQCRIYIHKDVSKGREDAMAAYGASVIRIDGDYDESVRLAASEAAANGWQIISDTSYEGYMDIPRLVMAGYTIMVREILEQAENPPTHIIVQAGVGGLAAAICASFWAEMGENRPRFMVTESIHAACIIESMQAGKASRVDVEEETIMAGLSCGEISMIAWEVLSRGTSLVTTLSDNLVEPAMRLMAGENIEAGECGVPGIIALLATTNDNELSSAFKLDENSRVLVFGCEGATDQDLYKRIVGSA